MTLSFFAKVNFEGKEIECELEASVIESGFHFEHFGTKGFKRETEIESIMLISPHDDKEIEFIEDKISEGFFDDLAYQNYEKEINA